MLAILIEVFNSLTFKNSRCMVQIMAKEMFGVLVQESNEAFLEGMVVLESFNDLVAEMRAYHYDSMTFSLCISFITEEYQGVASTLPLHHCVFLYSLVRRGLVDSTCTTPELPM